MGTYQRAECWLCGQIISDNGLSKGSHLRVHIREGYVKLTQWNPNLYEATSKTFDKAAYQAARPHRAYTYADYFPITGNAKDAVHRRSLIKEMVKRKSTEGKAS